MSVAPLPPPPPPPPMQNFQTNGNGQLLADIRKGVTLKNNKNFNDYCLKGKVTIDLNDNNYNCNGDSSQTKRSKDPKMALVHEELQQKLKKLTEEPKDEHVIPNQILSPSLALFVQNKTKPLVRQASSDDSKVAGQMITHGKRNFVVGNKTKIEKLSSDIVKCKGNFVPKNEVTYNKKIAKPDIEVEINKTEIKKNILIPPSENTVVKNILNTSDNNISTKNHKYKNEIDIILTNGNKVENIKQIDENKEKEQHNYNLVDEASRLCKGLVNNSPTSNENINNICRTNTILNNKPKFMQNNKTFLTNNNNTLNENNQLKKSFTNYNENKIIEQIKSFENENNNIKNQISMSEYEQNITISKSPTSFVGEDYVQVSKILTLKRPKDKPKTNLKISHGKPNFVTTKSPTSYINKHQ